MEITEKMKRVLKESIRNEGQELSDEQLDEVIGGRGRTAHEIEVMYDILHENMGSIGRSCEEDLLLAQNASKYIKYIRTLPEGSPEVLFNLCTDYGALLKQ